MTTYRIHWSAVIYGTDTVEANSEVEAVELFSDRGFPPGDYELDQWEVDDVEQEEIA